MKDDKRGRGAPPKGHRNYLDESMINPYMTPDAEIAKCYNDASPIKNKSEYNKLNDADSILSCISTDLYHDVVSGRKKRA